MAIQKSSIQLRQNSGTPVSSFTALILGVRSDPGLRGVIPNSFDHIFKHIARTHDQQYLVRASYLEIYQVNTNDML